MRTPPPPKTLAGVDILREVLAIPSKVHETIDTIAASDDRVLKEAACWEKNILSSHSHDIMIDHLAQNTATSEQAA